MKKSKKKSDMSVEPTRPISPFTVGVLGFVAVASFALLLFSIIDAAGNDNVADAVIANVLVVGVIMMSGLVLLATASDRYRKLEGLYEEVDLQNRHSRYGTDVGYAALDSSGNVTVWSDEAEKITGWTAEDTADMPFVNFVLTADDRSLYQSMLDRFVGSGDRSGFGDPTERTIITKNGGNIDGMIRFQARGKGKKTQFDVWIEDAMDVVFKDTLTGLPNRRLLEDRLEMLLARSKRSDACEAVYFVDLDNFREVNNRLGEVIGDQILVDIGSRLQQFLRPSDTIARFGSDEFVILCEGLGDADVADHIANRLVDVLASPITFDSYDIVQRASIGVAVTKGDLADGATLIREAENAMLEAKQNGRNQHVTRNLMDMQAEEIGVAASTQHASDVPSEEEIIEEPVETEFVDGSDQTNEEPIEVEAGVADELGSDDIENLIVGAEDVSDEDTSFESR